jgi:chromosome segregation ATPase
LAACGGGAKDKNAQVKELNTKIEKLKAKKNDLDAQIHKLEQELVKLDPAAAKQNAKLVAVVAVSVDSAFAHYIELQGK